MESILKQILGEVSKLSSKIDQVDSKVDNLESKVDNLSERVTLVEQAQVRMESIMNTNFAALYDARELQAEFNERIETKVDILNSKIDTIGLQVNHHEHRFNRLKSI